MHKAEILQNDREILVEKLLTLTDGGVPKGQDAHDAVRQFLLDYALERTAGGIAQDHSPFFREAKTVRVIPEDSYEVRPGATRDKILIPHQSDALKILNSNAGSTWRTGSGMPIGAL